MSQISIHDTGQDAIDFDDDLRLHDPVRVQQLSPEYDPPARRSLWAFVTSGVMAIIFCFLVLIGYERLVDVPYKISTFIGTVAGNIDYHATAEALEAKQAEAAALAAENERLQLRVLEAEAAKEKAVIAAQAMAQQHIIAANARADAVMKAYTSLYDRANMYQAKTAEVVQGVYRMRQNMVNTLQSGKVGAATMIDIFSPLFSLAGDSRTAAALNAERDRLAREALAGFDADIGTALPQLDLRQLGLGMPDPATLMQQINNGLTLEPKGPEREAMTPQPRPAPPAPRYRQAQ